jgi:hypothetical protein
LRKQIANHRDQYDTGVRLCVGLSLLSLLSAALLLPSGGWWRLLPLLSAVLAWLSYRSAVTGAGFHGVLLMTAYDLHRFDMLKGLHTELPEGPSKEYGGNEKLSMFFKTRDPDTMWPVTPYRHDWETPVGEVATREESSG